LLWQFRPTSPRTLRVKARVRLGPQLIASVRRLWKSVPTAPESAPAGVAAVLTVQKYVALSPTALYAALRRDMGPVAGVKRERLEGEWSGFARIKGGHIEVFEERGRVQQINVFFDPPAQNRAHAHVLLGLSPDQPSTREVPAAFVWEGVFPGIREVWALRKPVQGTPIEGVMLKL